MADVSKITLPTNEEYDIKDSYAREQIENLNFDETVAPLYEATTFTSTDQQQILTFNSEAKGIPLRSVKVTMEPQQAGSSEPSLENIRPITGYNKVTIMKTGKNLWGGVLLRDTILASMPSATIDDSAHTISYAASAQVNFNDLLSFVSLDNKFKENTAYTIIMSGYNTSTSSRSTNLKVTYTDGTESGYIVFPTVEASKQTARLVTNTNKTVQTITKYNNAGTTVLYYDECGIFEGNLTIDDFQSYIGKIYNINFINNIGTIYGGVLDLKTGKLIVNTVKCTLDGTEDWQLLNASTDNRRLRLNVTSQYGLIYTPEDSDFTKCEKCSHFPIKQIVSTTTDVGIHAYTSGGTVAYIMARPKATSFTLAEWTSFLAAQYSTGTPVEISFKLQNEIIYYLTPQQIDALLGINNMWTNADEIEVTYGEYLEVVKEYADIVGDSILAAIAPLEVSYIASKNYSTGDFLFVGTKFYKVISSIASGATITPDTNVEQTTIAAQLKLLAVST